LLFLQAFESGSPIRKAKGSGKPYSYP